MTDSRGDTTAPAKASVGHRFHWHVALTHFPISFFIGSFGFMILHLSLRDNCFGLASYLTLIAGAGSMIPATISGWTTWKKHYKGFKGKLFINKIRISFSMTTVSILLVIYRTIYKLEFMDILHNIWHAVYFIGITFLLIGAFAEGNLGGRLTHH